jgi:hypothetical protein
MEYWGPTGFPGDVAHAAAPGEEGLDFALAPVLGAARDAAVLDPAHEEVDVSGREGFDLQGKAEVQAGALEVAKGLRVGLDGAVGLALDLAGLEVEGSELVEPGHGVQPPLIRWCTHIALKRKEVK